MAKYVLLRFGRDADADQLLEDMAAYPDDPILTPVQENPVHATVVDVRPTEFPLPPPPH